ncbi:TetR/AcrR family transcriptional regulator [Paenibacillus melissococcoides]|uniref:TetR/AcrR family transcriptional regulator n=1 Tax=Paenibacillus melissococcoides TaxID=2912268 RepID=A0ABN8UIG0_9BACL|nr:MULTISPECIES: TetR/AcrR family transcriptional regulator [Paenibacillus]MEB9892328.1 TetR/AcrR family transcriptional regulator [Bacillus cereus]CAH8249396.1 TetR/AcrR family transcriptional regulator [Paenibacillus melissococcoides]CAH8721194.1 TetR/AcrR family transcriptional regulator [Paenibacillus melissococcoides]CAH8721526.1 TetR/AcrR family transcriptional regulator [Paenibacillus melissococcoides]GIO81794.1 TetR family transcriptional regulator [Paenibacillus dendritiformis]
MSVDRRKLIVDAAAQSFALFGYKATTMDQVAKIAKVGKGTIYTFFTNKEELFDEILQQLIMEMKGIADREIQEDKPFFDNLYRVLDRVLEFRGRHELAIKLSQEVRDLGTPMAREAIQKLENELLTYIECQVRLAMEKGEVKGHNPKIISFVMLQMYKALTTEWNKLYDPLDKEEIKFHFRLHFMEGLAP